MTSYRTCSLRLSFIVSQHYGRFKTISLSPSPSLSLSLSHTHCPFSDGGPRPMSESLCRYTPSRQLRSSFDICTLPASHKQDFGKTPSHSCPPPSLPHPPIQLYSLHRFHSCIQIGSHCPSFQKLLLIHMNCCCSIHMNSYCFLST